MRAFVVIAIVSSFVFEGYSYAQVPLSLRQPTDYAPAVYQEGGVKEATPRTLAPLVIAPTLGLNFDSAGTTPVPAIHAEGDTYLAGSETDDLSLLFQGRLDLNARPAAGDKADVASRIKLAPGNLNLDLGIRASWFPNAENRKKGAGTFGIDLRVAATGAFQAGDSPDMQGAIANSRFGLFSGQVMAAVWLWYFYLGGQGNYYVATGSSDVATAINKTKGFTGTAILPVKQGSGADEKTYYFQFTAGGDTHDVVTSFAITAQFTPF